MICSIVLLRLSIFSEYIQGIEKKCCKKRESVFPSACVNVLPLELLRKRYTEYFPVSHRIVCTMYVEVYMYVIMGE